MTLRTLIEGRDWDYVIPDDSTNNIHIKILNGEYENTVFYYGKVKIDEAKDGTVHLIFEYNIVYTDKTTNLEKSDDFKNYIGDILVNIMSGQITKGLKDEAGDDYFEESTLQ